MGFFKNTARRMRLDAAQRRKLDEILHEIVDEEMTVGEMRRGLWTKALAEAEGDEARAKGKYIPLRVQSLTDEMLVMSDALAAAKEALQKYRPVEQSKWTASGDANSGKLIEVEEKIDAQQNQPRTGGGLSALLFIFLFFVMGIFAVAALFRGLFS